MPVVDLAANQLASTDLAKTIAEYAETARRYQKQLQEWQNMLSKAQNPRLPWAASSVAIQLQERADDEGMADRCRDADGGPVALRLLSAFNIRLDPNGDLRDQQRQLCALQVTLENRRWNENVLLMRQMELHRAKTDSVFAMFSSGMTQGALQTAAADQQKQAIAAEQDRSESLARIRTYDQTLASVAYLQAATAERILRGSQSGGLIESAVGTIVQGAVLETALEVGDADCGERLGVRCD